VDWKILWTVLLVGIALVLIQGLAAWMDGYFTQDQIKRVHGITSAYSFVQHGGMWSDVFIITPIVAYISSKYELEYTTWRAIILLLAAVVLVYLAMEFVYKPAGIKMPEAHTHDGRTPLTGWVHALYAVAAIWVCVEVYLGWTTPVVSSTDIIVVSLLLTPFFYLGVAKFSNQWVFDTGAKWQVGVEIVGLWLLTGWRVWFS
jgi:hypothetical protein